MKTAARVIVNPQMGIDLSIPAPQNTAQLIENFGFDAQTKAWTSQLGYEPFFNESLFNGPFTIGNQLNAPVDSLYVFQRHQSRQQHIIFECNGKLVTLEPWTSDNHRVLATNRTIPTPNSARTAYEQFGRYVVITNGIDAPVKWRGDQRLFPLGWAETPGTPTIGSVRDPGASGDVGALEASDDYVGSGNNIYQGDDAYFEGVTSSDADETVEYVYRVSFINENGSESPLSGDSNKLVYSGTSVTRDGFSGVPKLCVPLEIPTGPEGTVARRIYRTQKDGNRSLFYYLDEIKNNTSVQYVDYRSDASLGAQAPDRTFSVPFPSKGVRFTASFKNCLFIDGGEMDPTRLYYSAPLEPDRYPALNYFEVGTREGGDIVGLETYYNSLLVFRENGIDLIRGDATRGFELVPFVEGIGAYSHNTIIAVPNLGVSFVSRDGIYLISGGLDGGSDLTLVKLSKGLDEIFERLSIDSMPAAVAAYSARRQELWFHLPTSGKPRLTLGLVYHTNNGQWSQRGKSWPIRCMAVDRDQNILFGADDWTVQTTPGSRITRGIYAVSGKRAEGTVYPPLGQDLPVEADPLQWEFRSQWVDMGLPYLKKYPKYLYMYAISTGDHDVNIDHFRNRDWSTEYEGGQMKGQVADEKDQPFYDSAKYLWDKITWQDKRLIQVRLPVTTGAVSEYAFRAQGNEPFVFIGYSVEYNADGAMTIKGKS